MAGGTPWELGQPEIFAAKMWMSLIRTYPLDLPIKNGGFPCLFVCLPEGNPDGSPVILVGG